MTRRTYVRAFAGLMAASATLMAAATPAGAVAQQAKLTAFDGTAGEYFGQAVSVSGDTAVMGSYTAGASGSAYVSTRSGGTWGPQAKLVAADPGPDSFGDSVSVSGDTVVVGAPFDSDNGQSSGSAYVFTRSGATWTQQAKLTPADGAADDHFGHSVAVSGDIAVVGSYFSDSGNAIDSGAAYVFTRSGATWTQQAKLTASDGSPYDLFGWSVSISGETVVAGSAYSDSPTVINSGAAYVFTRSGTTWSQQARLAATDGESYDQFGWSVSLSGDTVVVGASDDGDNGPYSGSAYVFTRSGTTWAQQAKLTASDGASNAIFGYSVAVSGDTTLVGAFGDDASAGSAYVFTRVGTVWSQKAKLTASDRAPGDHFGYAVSASGNTGLIGARSDDDLGTESGSAYVFGPLGNSPPVATDDTTATAQYEAVVIDVLDNDTDPDGDALSISVVTQPAFGDATVNPDGTITYTPGLQFKDGDTFTYMVADPSGAQDTATVVVSEIDCGEIDAVDEVVEPAAGGIDPAAAKAVHEVNCLLG